MWNPLRTLQDRDSARLRRLEKLVDDLANSVEIAITGYDRINAKLRTRARRAAEAGDNSGDSDGGDFGGERAVATVGGDSSSELAQLSAESSDRSSVRSQLRQLARSRGLLPSLSSQHSLNRRSQ